MQLEFIPVTRTGDSVGVDSKNRRRIRAHVQKGFRYKDQQKQGAPDTSLVRTVRARKADDEPPFVSPPRPQPAIHSPAVHTAQYLQKVADSWFPNNYRYSTMMVTISETFDAHGATTGAAPTIAINHGINILHVGSLTGDDRIVHEARKMCHFAINGLQLDVNRKSPRMSLAGVLIVGLGFMMAEIYFPLINGPSTSTWQGQILGVSNIVAIRQRDPLDFILENWCFLQLRVLQLVHALYSRKPFPTNLTTPEVPSSSVHLDALLGLAFQVPRLLQKADSLISGQPRDSDRGLLEDLTAQETALVAWLERFRASKPGSAADRHISLSRNQSSLFDLTCESLCRTCLLLVSESTIDVKNTFWHKKNGTSSSGPSDACATALSCIILPLAEAAGAPLCKARTVSGPLYFLSRYYARTGNAVGLRWCGGLKRSVRDEVPYLRWDALFPWHLLALAWVPT